MLLWTSGILQTGFKSMHVMGIAIMFSEAHAIIA